MWRFNQITKAEYRGDYRFYIEYDDQVKAEIDLSDYPDKGPIFSPLKDQTFFKQAKVESGTLVWPNEADIAPETLYEKVKNQMQQRPYRTQSQIYLDGEIIA